MPGTGEVIDEFDSAKADQRNDADGCYDGDADGDGVTWHRNLVIHPNLDVPRMNLHVICIQHTHIYTYTYSH